MTKQETSSEQGPGTDSTQDRSSSQSSRATLRFVVLLAVLALAGTFALYWEALRLPLFFDDMIHLRWLDWHSLPSLWTTAEGLGYYRPLTMSVWKVEELLLGGHGPQRLHFLSLLLHALNAGLAGYVGWRAFPGRGQFAYAILTMLLFLTFPFSYQAVPSTSSLSKPLIATLVLGSSLLYWEGRRRQSKWLFAPSLLLAFLAPFAYESGVMVSLAILSIEALGHFRGEFKRLSWLPVLYIVLVWGIALPLILLSMPETGASLGLPSLRSLWQNGIYFLEGLLFPVSFVTTYLARILHVDQYILLTMVVLLGFAGPLAFYAWARQLWLLLYALSWFAVGVLPLWYALDFGYVITSPRLFYLGAVGAALLWAGVPVLLWMRVPALRWRKALALVCAASMLAFNVVYVREKMVLAADLATPLWQAVRAAENHESTDSLLYLNVPAWIAPKRPTYRVGTEGLTFIPEYVRVQDFVYVNSGAEPRIRASMFDPAKQETPAYIGYSGEALDWDALAGEIGRADGVYLTRYSSDGMRFVEAGAREQTGTAPGEDTAVARFGDGIWLSDYRAELAGTELELELWWYGEQMPEGDVTVFVHVYDGRGQLVGQGDGYPLMGLYPPRQWQSGDTVHDIRYLELPEGMASGDYTVAVGWYDVATGERLPAVDQQNQQAPQDAIPVFEFNRP